MWTPPSVGLPPSKGRYILAINTALGPKSVGGIFWGAGPDLMMWAIGHEEEWSPLRNSEVIAWMPMPAAPSTSPEPGPGPS